MNPGLNFAILYMNIEPEELKTKALRCNTFSVILDTFVIHTKYKIN